jgi:hypothetical protein
MGMLVTQPYAREHRADFVGRVSESVHFRNRMIPPEHEQQADPEYCRHHGDADLKRVTLSGSWRL